MSQPFTVTVEKDRNGFRCARVEGCDLGDVKANEVRAKLLNVMIVHLYITRPADEAAAMITKVEPLAAKLSAQEWLEAYRTWTGKDSEILTALAPFFASKR